MINASGENLTFGTLATWQKPAETLEGPRYHLLGSDHSHVRLCQMQASEFVASEQALVLGSAGQGRRRGR